MKFYSIWSSFICIIIFLIFARINIFRFADIRQDNINYRISNIDGLRGYLAISVFLHHAAITHQWVLSKIWNTPPSVFFTLLGQIGVALFFIITGFLFSRILLSKHGVASWQDIYIGRIFRIGPLYLLAIFLTLFIVMWISSFSIKVSAGPLLRQSVRWLSSGVLAGNEFNGFEAGSILAGVTWTLQSEWLFYICLPLIALTIRINILLKISFIGIIVFSIWSIEANAQYTITASRQIQALLFFIGIFCASLPANSLEKIPQILKSGLVFLLFLAIFVFLAVQIVFYRACCLAVHSF